MSRYSVSGDAEHIYVSDAEGRIVATCPTVDDAERVARSLNGEPEPFYPFGKLDPDNPIDQAIVKAFNGPPDVVPADDPPSHTQRPGTPQ